MQISNDTRAPKQPTEEGVAFKAALKHIRQRIARGQRLGWNVEDDPELAELAESNQAILALRDLTPGNVHVDEVLTTMSVMYANDELIGLRLMPQVFTNGQLSGIYFTYPKRDRLAYPDDEAGDKATPNEINQNRAQATYSLTDRALNEWIGWLVIQNQSAPLNELLDAQNNCRYAMEFNRELRIAAVVDASGSYDGNVVAVAAGDRFDVAGSDPGAIVDAGKELLWSGAGPGRLVLKVSLPVYNTLKRHPKILDTFKYGVGESGAKMANRRMLAEYFEVDEVLVAAARKDTANEGVAASYGRIWTDSMAIVRVAEQPSIRNAAFGYSFQDVPTKSELFWHPSKGSRGSYQNRCAHGDQQKVVAGDTSVIFTTPIN